MNFWTRVSRIILKNRYLILILIAIATTFLVSQMKHMRFSYTEANLLPEDHEKRDLFRVAPQLDHIVN